MLYRRLWLVSNSRFLPDWIDHSIFSLVRSEWNSLARWFLCVVCTKVGVIRFQSIWIVRVSICFLRKFSLSRLKIWFELKIYIYSQRESVWVRGLNSEYLLAAPPCSSNSSIACPGIHKVFNSHISWSIGRKPTIILIVLQLSTLFSLDSA
jgi:hypothetical protein